MAGRGDDLGPPPPVFRIPRKEGFPRGLARWLIVLAIGLVLYTLADIGKGIYANWLWFQSLGYASVYSTQILTEIWLFFAGAILFLAFVLVNLFIARRISPKGYEESFITDLDPGTLRRIVAIGLIAFSLFLAVVFGSVAAGEWRTVLQFFHRVPFGLTDPAFKRDVGFYVFTLPFLSFLQSWLLGAVVVVFIGVLSVYGFTFSLQNFSLRVSRSIRAHVGILLVLLLTLFICGYVLSIYQLDFSTYGVVFGATYADIHARLPAYLVLIVLSGLACLLIVADIVRNGYILAAAGLIIWILALVIGLGIYPALVERLSVQPNELNKERQYIQRNIDMTRKAYNLTSIDAQSYPANDSVTQDQATANANTIDNIPLWDPSPLLDTYKQLQEIRPLYVFPAVTVDRYTINNQYREVTLSPRALDQTKISANAQTWVNLKTFYTHGYGAVLSPVNEVAPGGLPNLFLKDIPPTGTPALTKPQIYFGRETDPYVIVDTHSKEFDYPAASGDQYTAFAGNQGVKLSSFLRKLVYAWQFGDTNILISNQISSQSLLLYHRSIQDRISQIAPFLQLDHDPYVVISGGQMYWIQDAYTTTDQFPYSQPSAAGFNYIRNSVKVVVNAYTGETTFYLIDQNDPIAASYARIFPKLFRPFTDMPADLQAHIRYPEDLFEVQSDLYRAYHMTDAATFYNKEDLWDIPQQVTGQGGPGQTLPPYYVIMRLPGQDKEEFVLIRPFTPANKTNAIAFFAGRSDGVNYGHGTVYVFPKSKQVFGPSQIEAEIDQTPAISQQLTLWNQSGSRVIRGNLLMIPLADSYLYVEPIYLEAQQSQLPQLQRVVVVNGQQIAMEPTLQDSLNVVFGLEAPTLPTATSGPTNAKTPAPAGTAASPTPAASVAATAAAASPTTAAVTAPLTAPTLPAGVPTPTATDAPGLAREASADYDRAQQLLRQGDFAGYQQALQQMKAALDRLVQLSATPAP
jgi:uncharacterized membrane protein (UPF0182 family)